MHSLSHIVMPDAHHQAINLCLNSIESYCATMLPTAQHWAILSIMKIKSYWCPVHIIDHEPWLLSIEPYWRMMHIIEPYWRMMHSHIDAWCTALSYLLMPDGAMDAQHWAIIISDAWCNDNEPYMMPDAQHWAILCHNYDVWWTALRHNYYWCMMQR